MVKKYRQNIFLNLDNQSSFKKLIMSKLKLINKVTYTYIELIDSNVINSLNGKVILKKIL